MTSTRHPPELLHARCPTCANEVTLPAAAAGRRARCRACGGVFVVSGESAVRTPPPLPADAAPAHRGSPIAWVALGCAGLGFAWVGVWMSRWLALSWSVAGLVALGAGLVGGAVAVVRKRQPAVGWTALVASLLAGGLFAAVYFSGHNGAVNADNYGRIRPGMALADVEAILGRPTTVLDRSGSGGRTVVVANPSYVWESRGLRDMHTIFVTVMDGKVSGKSQIGVVGDSFSID
ncbi:MAG TPA: hypothetical protein VEA69_09695 [Tepidisphaeraceae bacterium]|nr:hypothetical protein [Tepidisphaeraceae bacterium]